MFTNAEILTKILLKFIEPAYPKLTSGFIGQLGWVSNVENALKRIGIVNARWSFAEELSTGLGALGAEATLKPAIMQYLQKLPDEMIPEMAHSLVDRGLEIGHADLLDGYLRLDKSDLETLKKYLDCNLPVKKRAEYQIVEPDSAGSADGSISAGN